MLPTLFNGLLTRGLDLGASYCAMPRDYLSDTPLPRAMGFLVSQHGQVDAIPPPPFLSISPWESMRSGGAIPPLKRGISAILARHPMKTRQMGAIPPSAILSRKGIARYGGVSRTGAKGLEIRRRKNHPKNPPEIQGAKPAETICDEIFQ